MARALRRKFEHFMHLSADEHLALSGMAAQHRQWFEVHEKIVVEGDAPHAMHLVLEGWGYRYRDLQDGRRHIIGFVLPGDVCDFNVFLTRHLDHSIAGLSTVRMAAISQNAIEDLLRRNVRLAAALDWDDLVAHSIQREWIVSLGRRDALERVAHLFCETFFRLRAVGHTRGVSCDFPVTQAALAEATGLSAVHVNRTLRELRRRDLIHLSGRLLTIPDLDALMRVGLFAPAYLHLDRQVLPS